MSRLSFELEVRKCIWLLSGHIARITTMVSAEIPSPRLANCNFMKLIEKSVIDGFTITDKDCLKLI